MIRTQNLGKRFDHFWALRDINLQVQDGEVLGLLGPNGAGKTTTVRILTAILKPTKGSAQVCGYDVLTQPNRVRALVGVLTEQHGLYGRMPAREYLDFFGQLYRLEARRRVHRVEYLLDWFGLTSVANHRIGEYSKGMRQKLALARALLHDPPVLLLDEPTSAMDPESARLVRDAIKALRSEDRCILICTHNLFEAEELADRIAIIRRGRIVAQGTPQALKRQFLGPPEFEVRLGRSLDGQELPLPKGVQEISKGKDWLRYTTSRPMDENPRLVQFLVEHGWPVVQLRQVERNLEQVYLQAVHQTEKSEVSDAG